LTYNTNFVLILHYRKELKMTLSVRANLSTQDIDGELVILDKDNSQIHQLNSVASIIWEHIESGLDVNAISEQLINCFDIDEITARTDLDKVLKQLKELKLLT